MSSLMYILLEVIPLLVPLTASEFPRSAIDPPKLSRLSVGGSYEIRLVKQAKRGLIESSNFYPTYEGTVLKTSRNGVLLATSHKSGCEMCRSRVVFFIPYLGVIPLVLDTNVGVGQEELRGKRIWIPVEQIVMIYGVPRDTNSFEKARSSARQ